MASLACAVQWPATVLRTVHLLSSLPRLQLPVHDLTAVLAGLQGGPGLPPALHTNQHTAAWQVDTQRLLDQV